MSKNEQLVFDMDKREEPPEQPRYDERINCQMCQDFGLCQYCERGKSEIAERGTKKRRFW